MVWVEEVGKTGTLHRPVLMLADGPVSSLTNHESASVSGFEWTGTRRLRVFRRHGAKPDWPRTVEGVVIEWVVR